MAGKAFEILNWDQNTRYCPSCGVPTYKISDIGKKCPQCRQEFYPHISPAIIVRITKGDSVLMVRAKNFRGTYYGLVAGFLEAGETLEECVHREVMEETGIRIEDDLLITEDGCVVLSEEIVRTVEDIEAKMKER